MNVFRSNGLMVHWSDTSTERHVDVANCVSPTLLANNPGLAAGFAELSHFNTTDRMVVRTQPCPGGTPPATTETRAFSQSQGQTNVYGQANFGGSTPTGTSSSTRRWRPSRRSSSASSTSTLPGRLRRGHRRARARPRDRAEPRRPPLSRDRRTEDHAPGDFGTPREVNPWERITLDFLYGHTDASDGNSGDSTPPAGSTPGTPPAFDPDRGKLRAGGKGAKARKRFGRLEVLELRSGEGDGITSATITVYATENAAREAAGG